jgi:hypothetical protein
MIRNGAPRTLISFPIGDSFGKNLSFHVPSNHTYIRDAIGLAIRHKPAFTDSLILDVSHVGGDTLDPGRRHFETVVIQVVPELI